MRAKDDLLTLLKKSLNYTVFISLLKRELERTVDGENSHGTVMGCSCKLSGPSVVDFSRVK